MLIRQHPTSIISIPKLANNLNSIRQLTQDLNCPIIFFHSHCVFQDLAGKTILIAKEQDGL
uniref:Uncharacterized protein n=1 Tax=Cajanus cajan TaxID=3821 RepID=A0A151TB02_CAJCA|nr:hypothetical protein KK1_018823 [Cajanus cajan]